MKNGGKTFYNGNHKIRDYKMKNKYPKIMLLGMIVTLLSASTCYHYPDYEDESHHYKIYFENCWDKPVVIWSAMDSHWYNDPCKMYVQFNKLWRYDNEGVIISPGRIDGDYMKHDGFYENWFEDGDSLYIAVFDAERTDKNDSLRFVVSYLLSLDDLHKLDYHLAYPPTEKMRDLHMWPPYDELIKDMNPSK
jgi:hypothetical protein